MILQNAITLDGKVFEIKHCKRDDTIIYLGDIQFHRDQIPIIMKQLLNLICKTSGPPISGC